MSTNFLKPANRAVSILLSGINSGDLSLTLTAGGGVKFPSIFPFHITIDNEILECTNRSTDTLTVTRHAESTTAASHSAGAMVSLNATAQLFSELQTAVNTLEGAFTPAFIAASDATAMEKANALLSGGAVCDGTADEVEIIAAIGAGKKVMLSSGHFIITSSITKAVNSVWIEGQGVDVTFITAANNMADYYAIVVPGGNGWHIDKFTADGNGAHQTSMWFKDGIRAVSVSDFNIGTLKIINGCGSGLFLRDVNGFYIEHLETVGCCAGTNADTVFQIDGDTKDGYVGYFHDTGMLGGGDSLMISSNFADRAPHSIIFDTIRSHDAHYCAWVVGEGYGPYMPHHIVINNTFVTGMVRGAIARFEGCSYCHAGTVVADKCYSGYFEGFEPDDNVDGFGFIGGNNNSIDNLIMNEVMGGVLEVCQNEYDNTQPKNIHVGNVVAKNAGGYRLAGTQTGVFVFDETVTGASSHATACFAAAGTCSGAAYIMVNRVHGTFVVGEDVVGTSGAKIHTTSVMDRGPYQLSDIEGAINLVIDSFNYSIDSAYDINNFYGLIITKGNQAGTPITNGVTINSLNVGACKWESVLIMDNSANIKILNASLAGDFEIETGTDIYLGNTKISERESSIVFGTPASVINFTAENVDWSACAVNPIVTGTVNTKFINCIDKMGSYYSGNVAQGRSADIIIATHDAYNKVGADMVLTGADDQIMINAALNTSGVNTVRIVGNAVIASDQIVIAENKSLISTGIKFYPYDATSKIIKIQIGGSIYGGYFGCGGENTTFYYRTVALEIEGTWTTAGLRSWSKTHIRDLEFVNGYPSGETPPLEFDTSAIYLNCAHGIDGEFICGIDVQNIRIVGQFEHGIFLDVACVSGTPTYEQPWINANYFSNIWITGSRWPIYMRINDTGRTAGWPNIYGNIFRDLILEPSELHTPMIKMVNSGTGVIWGGYNEFYGVVYDWSESEGPIFDFGGSNGNLVEMSSSTYDYIGNRMYTQTRDSDEELGLEGNILIDHENHKTNDALNCNNQTITVGELIPAYSVVYRVSATGEWKLASASTASTTRGRLLLCQNAIGGGTCTNGTGHCSGSPVTLALGSNTITVTQQGTFTIHLNGQGVCAILSGITGLTPTILHPGDNVVTATGTGTFTITPSSVGEGITDGYLWYGGWSWDCTKDIFLSTTAGLMTQTPPSSTGNQIRIVACPRYGAALNWAGCTDLTYGEI